MPKVSNEKPFKVQEDSLFVKMASEVNLSMFLSLQNAQNYFVYILFK